MTKFISIATLGMVLQLIGFQFNDLFATFMIIVGGFMYVMFSSMAIDREEELNKRIKELEDKIKGETNV